MDLSKRFSLDYLLSGSAAQSCKSESSASQLGRTAMEDAIKILVSPVLRSLDKSENQSARIFDLYDSIRSALPETNIDNFRCVINWMESSNLLRIVEPDSHGNDLIQKIQLTKF